MKIDDIALTIDREITAAVARHLVDIFGSAENLFASTAEEITELTELHKDVALRLTQKIYHSEAQKEASFAEKNRIKVISASMEEYPQALMDCPDRPHVLYVKGDTDLNSPRWISIVGTRTMTKYGQKICDELIEGLAAIFPDLVIVSGLAYGVDVAAQRAALNSGLKTVSVLGNPLTHIYPRENTSTAKRIVEKGGAIISEYHSEYGTHRGNFVERNRIIAGLSDATIVVESPASGGSLYTAEMASGYHRAVMAVPGRTTDKNSAGTNGIIKSMLAQMVVCSKDIAAVMVSEMGWTASSQVKGEENTISVEMDYKARTSVDAQTPTPTDESTEAMSINERVYKALPSEEPSSFEDILERAGVTASELSASLFELEMERKVATLPGKMYERK